jgi:predicted nucleotidyltransferase
MVRRIVERFAPRQVILFGSHARGQADRGSDVDLLVVLPANGSNRQQAAAIYGALTGLGVAKDIVVVTPEDVQRLRHVPGTLVRTALAEGRVLYESPA